MPARFEPIGEPAHDGERLALDFLVQGLPDDYTVYGNPWVVQQNGQVFEVDAVVVGENGVYVVEMKSFRGLVSGNELDWTVGKWPRRSPVKLNRKTAQILKTELKRKNGEARRIWVQGFIFLTHTERTNFQGQGQGQVCGDVVYTRSTILGALRNAPLIHRLSGAAVNSPSQGLRASIHELLKGVDPARQPLRTLGDYELQGVYERTDAYVEHLGKNPVDDTERILRFWEVPPLATEQERETIRKRARWVAHVLERLHHPHIARSESLREVDAGFVLPMHCFRGLTLTTWLDRYGDGPGRGGDRRHPDTVPARIATWRKIVGAIGHAHEQGVVHRLLRPEVISLEDTADDPDLRVGGFELAKRIRSEQTVSWTAAGDERLGFAAPEVVSAFSEADPKSDQFSLGALLGHLLAGQPLFADTAAYMKKGRLDARPGDFNGLIPGELDRAVERMLALRAPDRFPTLDDALAAVERAAAPRRPSRRVEPPSSPDNLAPGLRIGDFDVVRKLGDGGLAVVYSATLRATGRGRWPITRHSRVLPRLHPPSPS